MTVNYIVMYCNTLHYTVEYTVMPCSSGNKTRPANVAGMWSGCYPPRTCCSKKCTEVLQKTNINLDNNRCQRYKNPNRAHGGLLQEHWKKPHGGFFRTLVFSKTHHCKKCWLSKYGFLKLIKNKSEISVNTCRTWQLKVKVSEC